jgi:hypothetical protein
LLRQPGSSSNPDQHIPTQPVCRRRHQPDAGCGRASAMMADPQRREQLAPEHPKVVPKTPRNPNGSLRSGRMSVKSARTWRTADQVARRAARSERMLSRCVVAHSWRIWCLDVAASGASRRPVQESPPSGSTGAPWQAGCRCRHLRGAPPRSARSSVGPERQSYPYLSRSYSRHPR